MQHTFFFLLLIYFFSWSFLFLLIFFLLPYFLPPTPFFSYFWRGRTGYRVVDLVECRRVGQPTNQPTNHSSECRPMSESRRMGAVHRVAAYRRKRPRVHGRGKTDVLPLSTIPKRTSTRADGAELRALRPQSRLCLSSRLSAAFWNWAFCQPSGLRFSFRPVRRRLKRG